MEENNNKNNKKCKKRGTGRRQKGHKFFETKEETNIIPISRHHHYRIRYDLRTS
jgi:hypothetical protein